MVCLPVVSFTRATFRFAEFGFFGFMTKIWDTIPLRWGPSSSSGALILKRFLGFGLFRTDWLSVRRTDEEAWNDRD